MSQEQPAGTTWQAGAARSDSARPEPGREPGAEPRLSGAQVEMLRVLAAA
jgi:hypothetical protein